VRVFLGLWATAKLTSTYAAYLAGLPPIAFRPTASLAACGFEMTVVLILLRRSGEYLLLINLGLRPGHLLAPLVALHLFLDAILGLLAR
jgi:hypothetical protein